MVSDSLPLRPTTHRLLSFIQFVYYCLEGLILLFVPEQWRHKDVSGQTVLITGAGSGIGQLIAVRFAALGCRIVLWDVNEDGMRQTAEIIHKLDAKSKVISYKVDLSKRDEIYQVAEKMKPLIGAVDILVNNAGVVSGRYLLDTPDHKIEQTFRVNTLAHFYTVKCFLPEMIKQKRGHIVTVASVAGNIVGSKVGDYCASKFANVGFDYALRVELAQADLSEQIKTTIVKPYLITTGMFEGAKSFLLPDLSPDYVASRVVSGVLANSAEVILPYYFWLIYWLAANVPSKALIPFLDFAGTGDFMTHFRGRNSQEFTKEMDEINNNIDLSNNHEKTM